MKKIVALLLAAFVIATASPAMADSVRNLKCDGEYSSGTYRNVTVNPGASCVLDEGVTVVGGVHAKKGAENLYVHVPVGRNIQAQGVTGTVMVGPKGCKYDPPVGNNVMVKDSHNVLLCFVSAKNNIAVTHSDGRISVRDSVAGNNIMVTGNRAYVSDGAEDHGRPDVIRIFRNEYGNHLFHGKNDRTVFLSTVAQQKSGIMDSNHHSRG